jgi:phosphoglycolate phosphatase
MAAEFSTIVFDLDGTLTDPSEGIARCINHALEQHGFGEVTPERVKEHIGPPLDDIFAALVPSAGQAAIERMIETYRERYASDGFFENHVYPDIPVLLDHLARGALRLGVCTSKRKDFAVKILEWFGLHRYFAFVDGGDAGISKQRQLSRLLESGVIDRNAVMVGDRSVDVVAARRNALRAVGVLWGFGSHSELANAQADFLASNPEHLRHILVHGGEVQPPVVPAPGRRGR